MNPLVDICIEIDGIETVLAEVARTGIIVIFPVCVPLSMILEVLLAECMDGAVVVFPNIFRSSRAVYNLALGVEWHELMLGEGLALVN